MTLLLGTVTLAPAASFSLGGQLRNPAQARPLGSGPLTVLLTNLGAAGCSAWGP